MIEFPLRLRLTNDPVVMADGWLLPDAEVEDWIRWLCRWMGDGAVESLLMPIPGAVGNRNPAGLFVIGQLPCRPTGRAIPYRLLGGRLFVPADAELRYPLREEEFATLFLSDVNLLHPRIGLVAADRGDLLRLADLLSLPRSDSRRWNRAHVGLPALPKRLRFGVIVSSAAPEEILEQGQEDIGTREPKDLAPKADERAPGMLNRGAQEIRNALHKAILSFTSRMPNTAQRRTWINRLEDWANRKLSDLDERREREIERLLDMLRNDPDKGLRHAFPIGGDNSFRGHSEPGATLPESPVDFDLRDLAGGGATDPWDLRRDHLEALSQLYRRTADRELALRRFRRAAYIYAKLLNDYESAAQSLRQGGYFREAAALYRKRLSADKTAAECLRAGGLYEEAAAIYEELREFEMLGEMFRELGREEEACEAFERAVDAKLAIDQTLAASRIIDRKLNNVDRARQVLWNTWPKEAHASDCLEEYFRLLARDDEGERARRSLKRLAENVESLMQRMELGELFGRVHERFSNDDVRSESADHARVLIGDYLRENGPRVEDATRIIHSFDKGDRLLERDARAFARERLRKRPDPAAPAILPTNEPLKLKLKRRERVSFRIQRAVQCRWGTLVLGMEGTKPTIQLLGQGTKEQWFPAPEWQVFDAVFVAAGNQPRPDLLYVCSNVELEPRSFRHGSGELRIVNRAYVTTSLDSTGRRFECSSDGFGKGVVRGYCNDALESTSDFVYPSNFFVNPEGLTFMPMRATPGAIYIGAANSLLRIQGNNRGRVEIPAQALSMVHTEGHPTSRLMFHMEFGAGLFRDDDSRWEKVRYFASDMAGPRVDFLPSGHLMAANADLLRVYVVGRYEISRVAEIPGPDEEVIGVLPGPGTDCFRMITANEVATFAMKSA